MNSNPTPPFRPIRIGITGGIGSGKSLLCKLLEVMDIPVYISDTETKQLMLTDTTIHRELTALLGDGVYADGTLNKPLLADYLFANVDNTRRINGIIHPAVKADYHRWVEAHADSKIVGIESAILIEAGFTDVVDFVVLVSAPEEVRIARAALRDGTSAEAIARRVRSQTTEEEKMKHADFIIRNDGETPLIPQVWQLLTALDKNRQKATSAQQK